MNVTENGDLNVGQIVKRISQGLIETAGDVTRALHREHEYYTAKRTRALLCLTWACTSRCTTCTIWRRVRDASQELSRDEWLAAADKLVGRGLQTVELFGGDVLLRKDVLFPLARRLKSLGCQVHMATNSNLLDAATARELAACVDYVYLSTDGLGELHDRIRGVPGTFGRVREALGHLLAAREGRRWPAIICNTTVSRYNAHVLSEIAAFAARAGFDEIDFEYVGEIPPESVARSRIGEYVPAPSFVRGGSSSLARPGDVPVMRRQLDLARAQRAENGSTSKPFKVVTTSIDALSDSQLVKGTVPLRPCFMERTEIVIDPYGNIVPCCFFDNYVVGNVREGALDRSWETAARVRFRRARQAGRLDVCKHCIVSIVRNRTAFDTFRRAYFENFRDPMRRGADQAVRQEK